MSTSAHTEAVKTSSRFTPQSRRRLNLDTCGHAQQAAVRSGPVLKSGPPSHRARALSFGVNLCNRPVIWPNGACRVLLLRSVDGDSCVRYVEPLHFLRQEMLPANKKMCQRLTGPARICTATYLYIYIFKYIFKYFSQSAHKLESVHACAHTNILLF